MRALHRTVVALVTSAVCGCTTIDSLNKDIETQRRSSARQITGNPVKLGKTSRVENHDSTFIPVLEVPLARDNWLRKIRVTIAGTRNPLPISEVIKKFSAQGINIASDLPLGSYTFAGEVNTTDAESALRLVLGSAGLDFKVDTNSHLVTIKPLSARTWYINLGNRRSNYSSASSGQQSGASPMSGQQTGGLGQSSGQNGQGGSGGPSWQSGQGVAGNGGQNQGQANGAQISSGANGQAGVTATDDFWESLESELKTRLSMLVPNSGSISAIPVATGSSLDTPPMPNGGGTNEDSGELYAKRKLGDFSLNPETGAVTVQAPHWVLEDLNGYFTRVQEMYNTDIAFTGELVLVSTSRTDSEGLEISSFGTWAKDRYGAIVANNGLGGVTVSFPNSGSAIPNVTAGSQSVGGALLGIQSPLDGIQVFNNYLSEQGQVAVLQRPVVTTTSGVPGEFSKISTKYFNTTSQQAAPGGTGSAVQATQNVLVPKEFGTLVRINPRYDIATGLIRAQITVNNVIPAGNQVIKQTISVGSSFQTIPTEIPLDTKLNYAGEALLRDGDLIIVGGQTETNLQVDENGLPGDEGPISAGVFGTKKGSKAAGTFYFALRVSVTRR